MSMRPCSVHLSTHRYPVHIAHVHESHTHPIAGSAAHNPRRHVSCITDTYPGHPYHMCRIHLLCTCHSHMALTCVHGSHTLLYLFRFLPHTDTLGGPVEPPLRGSGGVEVRETGPRPPSHRREGGPWLHGWRPGNYSRHQTKAAPQWTR